MSEFSQSFCIDSTHPSLAGHFPGNPIVPGVVLLDYARTLLQQWRPGGRISSLSQCKFLKPLRPDQVFIIKLMQVSPTLIKFELECADEKLLAGAFIVEGAHD